VERAEAAAERRGETDGAEEGAAGERGADEAREGGEAEEDLAEEFVAEGVYCGGGGWYLLFLRRRRWLQRLGVGSHGVRSGGGLVGFGSVRSISQHRQLWAGLLQEAL
jgi:hypothetical protein